ncbi:MAG: adenosylcobinamide-GDP ribazoletransferase [Thermogemmatispora sp.]|uniref:adenosylcobinamide-GDP ribazoletransferase n=1 Tax=Thermogemmatispora sp. TaxID=1968838 RepID=UPI00261E1F4F|nr:adenosylcobinamide-GDP ribazoletransferase [Thermogemmatispora sp.]MBX5456505.1 adenosylcobinamide-GDP ribazoletransferase [Thermogemmatispora sp.]
MRTHSDDSQTGLALQAIWRPWTRLGRFCRNQYAELVAAVLFLTILPLPGRRLLASSKDGSAGPIVGSVYYPLVGLILGAILCLCAALFTAHVPALVLAALLVLVGVTFTGGLHLDGVMDSCDGLFGGLGRERRLEIMHDSRVGSFGVLGASTLLLLRFAILASLPFWSLLAALLVAPILGRWAMVLAGGLFPAARPDGLGAAFHQAVTLRRLLLAGLSSVLMALLFAHLIGLFVWLLTNLLVLCLGIAVTRSLGGLTGDVCGALGEICEVCALLLFLLMHVSL